MIIFQISSIILWLLMVPFCLGLLPVRLMAAEQRRPGTVFLAGYTVMFAVFELIAIPVVLLVVYHGMAVLTGWFTVIALLLAAAGLGGEILAARKGQGIIWRREATPEPLGWEEKVIWLLFFLLLGFQLYMAFTRASFDGDDAYYVVHSLTAQQQDVLYRIEPDTGKSTPLDIRHALAVFPLWLAHVAVKSGVHGTIISHTVVPLILLPLTYLLYFQIGKKLLGRDGKKNIWGTADRPAQNMLPVFMVIMALLQMFGNVSIYTGETFLMTRAWQGKSLAANFMLPAILWLFLWIFEEDESSNTGVIWLLLGAVNWMAGMGSSQAVFLCAMLTGILGFLMTIRTKNFWVLVKTGAVCVPNGIYIGLYLIMTR